MKICCCYRVIPNGEAIHTYVDSDTHVADLMPTAYLDSRELDLAEYNPHSYNGKEVNWMANCEAILLSNSDYALVIESGTIGYFVLQWDSYWRFLETPMDEKDKGRWLVKPQPGNFAYIGYRPTKLMQYRSCSGIYRLAYDRTNNTIVTDDGIFTPAFDVSKLSPIDYHYAGYKDTIKYGKYAVVYFEDGPHFLMQAGNKLVLES